MSRDSLVVGINTYDYTRLGNLKTPAEDAEAIARILNTYGDFRVRRFPEIIDRETNATRVGRKTKVTLAQLEEALVQLFKPPGEHVPETALFYFSGHGLRKDRGIQEGFLATSDVNPDLNNWGLRLKWLRELLQESPVKQQIVLLDCCYSGELLNFDEADPGNRGKGRDRCFIAASREYELAYEETAGNHGVLTNALLQGLDPTRQMDGLVSNFTLVEFINQTLQGATQRPIYANSGGQILLTGKGVKENTVLEGICPYKGLAYFDYNDEDPKYFHGRTTLTDQLLEKIRQGNFLAVMGASGSGKSSVVRAGLLYQLKLGQRLSGSDRWAVKIFRPGKHPLQSLAWAFVDSDLSEIDQANQAAKAEDLLEAGTVGLSRIVKAFNVDRVILVVDQFEEVFTLCKDNTERQRFFECLLNANECLDNKLTVVLAVRADFYGKCAEQNYAGLASKIQANLVTVTPMNQKELESAVIEPAKQVGLEVDQDLVTQIIADVDGSPGSLPLLQYALTKLWKQRVVNRLTLSAYTRLGGVKGTLQKQANEVYQSLSTEEQQIAKRIFLELTQLGEGTEDTRRQVYKQDLVNLKQSADLVDQVIQKLTDAKLVVTSELIAKGSDSERIAVVDVAHEALIRHWSLLREWINENRDALRKKRSIEEDAQEWVDKENPIEAGYLLQGLKLDAAEEFIEKYASAISLSTSALELVQASQLERDRQKAEREQQQLEKLEAQVALDTEKERTQILTKAQQRAKQIIRRGVIVLAIITPSAIVATVVAATAFNKAIEAQEGTRLEQAGVSALRQFRSGELEALLSAMQSAQNLQKLVKTSRSVEDYPAISPLLALQTILDNISEQNRFDNQQGADKKQNEIRSAQFSPDSKLIATAGEDGIVRLWNIDGRKQGELRGHQGGVLGGVNFVSFNPSSSRQLIATAGGDGTAQLWDYSGKQILELAAHKDGVSSLAFSPDGSKLVTAGIDGSIKLWDLSGKQLAQFTTHGNRINSLAFSPTEQKLATASKDGTVQVWDLSGKQILTLKPPKAKQAFSVSFSPDGQYLAAAFDDDTARIWNLFGQEQGKLEGHQSWVTSVKFSPDGKKLATASDDGTARIWDLSGQQLAKFQGHRGVVWVANFSPDGNYLLTSGRDGSTRLWNLSHRQGVQFIGHQNDVNSVSISPDGKTIATAGDEGVIKLWNTSGKLNNEWQALYQGVGVLSTNFHPSQKLIAIAGRFKVARIFDLSGDVKTKLEGHKDTILDIKFSPDGKLVATASSDKTARIWKLDGEQKAVLKGHQDRLYRIDFSNNSKLIATGAVDGTIGLWDISGKKINLWKGHVGQIRGLSFSLNNRLLATADNNSSVKLWDLSGKQKLEFFSYQSGVNDLRFSPDGQFLATAGMDGSIRVWDLQGRQLAEFSIEGPVWGISFSPDGHSIVAGGDKGTVRLWKLEGLNGLLTQGCQWLKDYLKNHPDTATRLEVCRDESS